MKRKTTTWLAVAAIALATLYVLREYTRTNKDVSGEKTTAMLHATALIHAFEKDSAGSNLSYVNKVLTVQGMVKAIEAHDNPVVITLGDTTMMSSVQCSMDSSHAENYKGISPGHHVTLKGFCIGSTNDAVFGTDVKLNRCIVEHSQ